MTHGRERPCEAADSRYYTGVRRSAAPTGGGVGAVVLCALLAVSGARPAAQPSAGVPPLLVGASLDVRWSTGPDVVAAPPAFDADSAYVVTRDRALVAIDLDSGAERWRATVPATLAPATGDGSVFVVADGAVHAFVAATGAPRWRRPIEGVPAGPPYWDTGWLLLSHENGDLAALRASDGASIWRQALSAPLAAAPAPARDRLYLGLADDRVVAVELASGAPVWTVAVNGRPTGVTALDDQLLVGTAAGALISLDLVTGRVRWRWRPGAPIVGAPVADDSRIYVASFDHILRALDRRNGALRWRRALTHRPAAGPVLLGTRVVMPSLSTDLEGYDVATGQPAMRVSLTSEVTGAAHLREGGRPTGTRLTAVSTEGHFLAFGLRIEPPPTPLAELPGTLVAEPAPTQKPSGPPLR